MSSNTKCLTPGAIYHSEIGTGAVGIKVTSDKLVFSEEEAKRLADRLHDVMEAELARYWS